MLGRFLEDYVLSSLHSGSFTIVSKEVEEFVLDTTAEKWDGQRIPSRLAYLKLLDHLGEYAGWADTYIYHGDETLHPIPGCRGRAGTYFAEVEVVSIDERPEWGTIRLKFTLSNGHRQFLEGSFSIALLRRGHAVQVMARALRALKYQVHQQRERPFVSV